MQKQWHSIKILEITEEHGESVIKATIATQAKEIEEILEKFKTAEAEVRICDGRTITHDQRKKIYATLLDIASYTGYESSDLKDMLKCFYCAETGNEEFSLSDCSLETAREFINFILEFAISFDIPLRETPIDRTDDISAFLLISIKHKKCCICGMTGTVYKLDEREQKMCLCKNHHRIAKSQGIEKFCKDMKVYGVKFNK